MQITNAEREHLESLYANRRAFHGELHDHANTGGTSDGTRDLVHWTSSLEALHMDFAAILDHRQVRHMYLPEWKDGLFLCGTEPDAEIIDSKAEYNHVHYNMLFDSPKKLEELLEEFPEYEFTGGQEGHFRYPGFTTERFCQLIDTVKAKGGMVVHPHPKQHMRSVDPANYWFRDWTGIEVFYRDYRDPRPGKEYTAANYQLWVDLLALGKRVWCCAGGDAHSVCSDKALTTVYAEEHTNASLLKALRVGDFTCGAVGVRMCIDDTVSGGECDLAGKRLLISVGDFHESVYIKGHTYRVDILNAEGLVCSKQLTFTECAEPQYMAVDTVASDFYRVEVVDEVCGWRIALGNPIWNVR